MKRGVVIMETESGDAIACRLCTEQLAPGATFFRLDTWAPGAETKKVSMVCHPCAAELANGVETNAGNFPDADAGDETRETTAEVVDDD